MRISIVTLNYNGSKETLELLKSLEDQTDEDFQIIVVDNASEEADFTDLQTGINEFIHGTTRRVVHIDIIRNAENLGFSGGNNAGIRQALNWNKESDPVKSPQKGDNEASWVVLLNNDTWVEKDLVWRLRGVLETRSGIVGIPLVEGDPVKSQGDHGASRVAYCGKVQWLKPTLIHSTTRRVGHLEGGDYYAIGGAMAVHKSVFDKIGLLDEKYFLYFEDADFSIRAKKAGFGISIADNYMIYHTVSATTKKLGSPLLLRYHYRNALYFNLKNGSWYIKLLVWPWSWIILIKQFIKIVIKQNAEESKAILAGVIDFYKNRMGKIM